MQPDALKIIPWY